MSRRRVVSRTCAIQPELTAPPVPMTKALVYPELRATIEAMRAKIDQERKAKR